MDLVRSVSPPLITAALTRIAAITLLGALGDVLRLLLAALESLFADLVPALQGLLAGLAGAVLDLVGRWAELSS